MARIDYKVSVTPVESTAATADGGPMQTETISANIRKTLGGGQSSLTWAGSDTTEWNAGVPTTVTSGGGTVASSSSDGIWIKHTGFDYDASKADNVGTTVNTANLTISTAGATSVTLAPGSAIFFPAPSDETFTMSDDGTPCAVEVANFT
jgi:hypothetical protein|tara:strand:+ start:219 stop:668 length:450 start_codon:yes stop_codon:yes gene_type:complete